MLILGTGEDDIRKELHNIQHLCELFHSLVSVSQATILFSKMDSTVCVLNWMHSRKCLSRRQMRTSSSVTEVPGGSLVTDLK